MLRNEQEEQLQRERQRQLIEAFVSKAASFQRVFSGTDGKIVLDYLKKQLLGFDKDPYQHAFNAGKARMVAIIEDMMDNDKYKEHVEYLKQTAERKENTDA